jgi:hypothetical protein
MLHPNEYRQRTKSIHPQLLALKKEEETTKPSKVWGAPTSIK